VNKSRTSQQTSLGDTAPIRGSRQTLEPQQHYRLKRAATDKACSRGRRSHAGRALLATQLLRAQGPSIHKRFESTVST